MGRMIHRAEVKPYEQKVFLATPAYSGVEAGYAFALFESVKALEAAGIGSELALFANDCHVDDSRNRLVHQFLSTDCTDLIFLDSDLRWEAKDLVNLCRFDVDVVGATYPLKKDEEEYPVRLFDGELVDGLYEAEALPTGFLRIKRHVLEMLANEAQKYPIQDSHTPVPLIFERTLLDGKRWGGDYSFCLKWSKHGKLYLYPDPFFEHVGGKSWEGSYAHYLRKQQFGAIHAGLELIRAGDPKPEAMDAMFQEWGNEWAGDGNLLLTVSLMAKGKKVLELGSGLSTLCMLAAGGEVHCLEHSQEWADKTISAAERYLSDEERSRLTIEVVPLVDGFYQAESPEVTMIVCDGPPKALGDRLNVRKFLHKLKGPIVMDDFEPNDLPFDWHNVNERVSIGYSTRNS